MKENDWVREMPTSDRMIWLDGIRGFALLGILFMNIQTFLSADYYYGGTNSVVQTTIVNYMADWFLHIFIIGKFYPIFSILFGISFALFLERIEEKGRKATVFYRRLMYLAIFGLIHLVFVWRGDILFTYALTGFVLMFFRNRSLVFIRRFAFSLFVGWNTIFALLSMLGQWALFSDSDIRDEQLSIIERVNVVYQQASYMEWLTFRLNEELIATLINAILSVFVVLPLFLIGYYLAKKIHIQTIHEQMGWLRKIWQKSLVFSLVFSILFIVAKAEFLPIHSVISYGLMEWFRPFAGLSMAIFYMSSFVLLYVRAKLKAPLSVFSFAGRMSLTNYLFQSIICSFIFYGYGLGLYGYVGTAFSLFIAMMIYLGLSIVSFYWLKIFQYGPLEWIWRTLTYQEKQPMRRSI